MKELLSIPIPGGGLDDGPGPACNSSMRFMKSFMLWCTRLGGHQGDHEAGVDDDMMRARWDDDRSTD